METATQCWHVYALLPRGACCFPVSCNRLIKHQQTVLYQTTSLSLYIVIVSHLLSIRIHSRHSSCTRFNSHRSRTLYLAASVAVSAIPHVAYVPSKRTAPVSEIATSNQSHTQTLPYTLLPHPPDQPLSAPITLPTMDKPRPLPLSNRETDTIIISNTTHTNSSDTNPTLTITHSQTTTSPYSRTPTPSPEALDSNSTSGKASDGLKTSGTNR